MSTPPALLLVRAAHPRQAVGDRAGARERPQPWPAARCARSRWSPATVLVGQSILGWADDLADRRRDERHRPDKPLAGGRARPGDGVVRAHLRGPARRTPLDRPRAPAPGSPTSRCSPCRRSATGSSTPGCCRSLPWMVSFALYPAFLAYGGWNGVGTDDPAHRGHDRARRRPRPGGPRPHRAARAGARPRGGRALLPAASSRSARAPPGCCSPRACSPALVAVAILIAGRTVRD